MNDSLKRQLLVLVIKILLLIMFFQILTLVGGLIIGSLLNEIYPTLEFKTAQAFTASTVATLAMIITAFVMAWFVYKNTFTTKVAAAIGTIPVVILWIGTLLFLA